MLLLFWLLFAGISKAQFIPGPGNEFGAGGPLSKDFDVVAAAAYASSDALNYPFMLATDTSFRDLLKARDWRNDIQSAVYISERTINDDRNFCIAAFRGGAPFGFAWVADLDLRKSYLQVKGTRKRCRVVRHYKSLYLNKGGGLSRRYRSQLNAWLDKCWSDNKMVLFTGHDIGGALATLAALEYARRPATITITFGQPPVFMPAQYKAPGRLGRGPRKKHPCKHMPRQYYQFVSTQIIEVPATPEHGPKTELLYDFMVYLQYFLYGMIDGETPQSSLACLVQAAENSRQFLLEEDDNDGNLGSNFGSRYLLPYSESFDATRKDVAFLDIHNRDLPPWKFVPGTGKLKKPQRFHVSFGNQGNYGIQYENLLLPELLETAGLCGDFVPRIHRMEYYLNLILSMAPDEFGMSQTIKGFAELSRCNVQTDCRADSTCHQLMSDESICIGIGSVTLDGPLRPVTGRKPPPGDGGIRRQMDDRR